MRQYIKPELSVEVLEEYSLMAASVKTESNTGEDPNGPDRSETDNDDAGSKGGFPWSDDFNFNMD